MLIKINGDMIEIPEGSTIREAIEISKAPYSKGSIVCLIKGESEIQSNILKYKIKTPKGSVLIELSSDDKLQPLVGFFKDNYKKFISSTIRWDSSTEVAMGPVQSNFEPSHDEFQYHDNDVLISLSGFSNEATHIIFIKDDVSNVYGVPKYSDNGVFAKVIGGRKTLFSLTSSDEILDIEPVIERSTVRDSAGGSDLDVVLEEGNQLFTYVLFKPNPKSPVSVEHLFSLIRNNKIEVSFESNSFVGFYELQGLGKDVEDVTERRRGTVTLRSEGHGKGKVFVYREDRVNVKSHTTIATVESGMELFDIAREGDFITVRSNPERIMLMMMTQKESEEKLKSLGIEHVRTGTTDDDAIVVVQEPENTIAILENNKVETFGIPANKLIKVELTDDAPRSRWYFEKLTGLAEKPVGSLKVYFAVPDMNIYMFDGDKDESKGLVPENVIDDSYIAGTIGITNMSRKNVGLVGIRTVDSDEFGPTGEPFNATNVVGRVISDLEDLKSIEDGDTVYVYEVYEEEES